MLMADEVSLGLSLSCPTSSERSEGRFSLELSLSCSTSGKRCRDSSSSSSTSTNTDDVTQELEPAPKRLKLLNNNQGHIGPIYCEGEYSKQALRIAAMKVYTAQEEEEEKKVATRLKLYEDPWTIKKVLTASDVNGSARLLLAAHLVEEHIIKKMDGSQAEKVYTGEGARIRVWDCDTDMSEHELTLKRWVSTGSYVLLNNWRREFEKRRGLKRGDEIALRWDPVKSLLWFRLLKQA